ncbi:DUF6928 family protein [Nocardiopsis coralliicola]
MGARTAVLAFYDTDPFGVLAGAPETDSAAAAAFLQEALPGRVGAPLGTADLDRANRPTGPLAAGAFGGVELVCGAPAARVPKDFARPPVPSPRRGALLHTMDSATDIALFAVWADQTLVRAVAVRREGSPWRTGTPLPFEEEWWAGGHADSCPGSDAPGRPPFAPLAFGDAALRHLLGFYAEGAPGPAPAVDPFAIELDTFAPARRRGRSAPVLR